MPNSTRLALKNTRSLKPPVRGSQPLHPPTTSTGEKASRTPAWQVAGAKKKEHAPFGYWEGKHHAGGNRSPRDASYQGDTANEIFRIARHADFAITGLTYLKKAGVEPLFAKDVTLTLGNGSRQVINLMKAKNDSVPVDTFYAAVEKLIEKHTFSLDAEHTASLGLPASRGMNRVTGKTVLKRIDATLDEAVRLADKANPEAAPIPNHSKVARKQYLTAMRRFMIQTVLHTMDLTKVHTAMGFNSKKYPQLNETLKHDMVERVPLKDLAWQLERRVHEPWMENWLRAEIKAQRSDLLKGNETAAELYAIALNNPELTFNCSALNPHYTTAMYRWGDSREDANSLMDPHRLSPHHNGNSAQPVDFQKRAVNFLSHHMPREHMGIRHESRGSWDTAKPGDFGKLEHALSTDPAIRESDILKSIARDASRFFRAMEEKGFAVPWHKLKVPDAPEFVRLDGAYQALQNNNKAADVLYAKQSIAAKKALAHVSAAVAEQGRALLKKIEELSAKSHGTQLTEPVAQVSEQFFQLVQTSVSLEDKALASALGQTAIARFTQLSGRTVESTRVFTQAAEALEPVLFTAAPELKPQAGHLFMSADNAIANRVKLNDLAAAAKSSAAAGDASTAQTYRNWLRVMAEGFPSVAN